MPYGCGTVFTGLLRNVTMVGDHRNSDGTGVLMWNVCLNCVRYYTSLQLLCYAQSVVAHCLSLIIGELSRIIGWDYGIGGAKKWNKNKW